MIGISRDDQETNDRFRESLGLPYPLLGDPEGTISDAYKVSWPLIGRSQRVTYLVARDHRIRLAFHDELRMDAHPGQACEAALHPPS